jgi:hypothetical protein
MKSQNIQYKLIAVISILLILFSFLPVQTSFAQDDKGNNGYERARLIVPEDGNVLPDQYIVVYKTGISAQSVANSVKAQLSSSGGKVKHVYSKALNGFSAYLPQKALDKILADPNVAYVAADGIVSLENVTAQTNQKTPPWGLDRIDQHVSPLNSLYIYTNTGAGTNLDVDVYILDTGINATHVEFGGRATKIMIPSVMGKME